jgi:hypothetical protein
MNRRDPRWIAYIYTLSGIGFLVVGGDEWWSIMCSLLLLGLAVWICFKN